MRQAADWRAVEDNWLRVANQSVEKLPTKAKHLRSRGFALPQAEFQRCGQANGEYHRLGAGPPTSLLMAAKQQRAHLCTAIQEQQANAERTAELVAAGAKRRQTEGPEIDRQLPDSL